ncbi:MAG: OmpA family protein [Nitrospira sp. BO4]|nr:OmpA family protein [Nitrospira sp. BO4]
MRQVCSVTLVGLSFLAVLLAQGCATKSGSGTGQTGRAQEERINEPTITEISPDDSQPADPRRSPAMQSELASRNATGMAAGMLSDILFDFDRDSIRMESMRVLEANAKQLQNGRATRLLLEGRGDEMGTSAYNLVLGERRARNVKSYLQQLGLSLDVNTTSYGKDRPLCFEHNGDCRQKNRSVHFTVK